MDNMDKLIPAKLHEDYQPLMDLIIAPAKRDRKRAMQGIVTNDDFREIILPRCTTGQSAGEVLRLDLVLKYKTRDEVFTDLAIQHISADQVVERIIQARQELPNGFCIIGLCENLMIYGRKAPHSFCAMASPLNLPIEVGWFGLSSMG